MGIGQGSKAEGMATGTRQKSAEDRALETNRALWDMLVDLHVGSEFYAAEQVIGGGSSLSPIETEELPDLQGQRVAHLMCHFGLDSLSLARRGARVEALDLSPKAVSVAEGLAKEAELPVRFVCGPVAQAHTLLEGPFDTVFMSWGVLSWLRHLPDLFGQVHDLLKPGGVFYLAEGHPILDAMDPEWRPARGAPRIQFPYFPDGHPLTEPFGPDYAQPDIFVSMQSIEWTHDLGEILTSLCEAGLSLSYLNEHDGIPWRALEGLEQSEDGLWRLPEGVPSLPLSFSLQARKLA